VRAHLTRVNSSQGQLSRARPRHRESQGIAVIEHHHHLQQTEWPSVHRVMLPYVQDECRRAARHCGWPILQRRITRSDMFRMCRRVSHHTFFTAHKIYYGWSTGRRLLLNTAEQFLLSKLEEHTTARTDTYVRTLPLPCPPEPASAVPCNHELCQAPGWALPGDRHLHSTSIGQPSHESGRHMPAHKQHNHHHNTRHIEAIVTQCPAGRR
jgi:hypothetical protein